MITTFTIQPLDLGTDAVLGYMGKKLCRGLATSAGHRHVRVPSAGRLDPSNGDNPRGCIARAAGELDRLIRATPGEKLVIGYSQGAQVAGRWLDRHGDADPVDGLQFLLIGNPERRIGKQPWVAKTTRDDTVYPVRDVARVGDKWANWRGRPTDNRMLAMVGGTHTDYWNVNPYSGDVVATAGNTTYVLVP